MALQRETFSGRERAVVSAGVINRGDQPVRDVTVNLEIDGKVVQATRVSAEPHGAASLTFPAVTLDARNTRGAVRIPDDRLMHDNVAHFVLSPAEPLGVALLGSPGASRDDAFYLARALAIGDRPRFDVRSHTGDDVPADVLARTRVLIVNDTSVSPAGASRFADFVEAGGGLLVALGPRSTWPERENATLSGAIGQTVDRTKGTPASLTALQYGHAIFEPFRAPRSGDFSSARFYGYRAFTPAPDAETLARFDDGAAAVVARRVGLGRVVVWSSTLDLGWSDLPLKPVYLPFVHRLVGHLAAYRERPTALTVGQVLELPATPGNRERVALAPSGQRLPIAGGQPGVLELREQGYYEVRQQGTDVPPTEVVASNVDLAESDLTPIDPQEMVAAVGAAGDGVGAGPAAAPADDVQERTQRIWWYLLFTGILLLTAETWLAHRLSRAA
ncbi:MAG: hypothetical protein LC791_05515 [Acidobacteria bacterium]|nr:hypothetical protein [Acidobacteriota bacterium]